MNATGWFRRGEVDRFDANERRKVWVRRLGRAGRMRMCDRCMSHRCDESVRIGPARCWKAQRATAWRSCHRKNCCAP